MASVILCAKCGGRSNVIDTREAKGTKLRRRACTKCKHRWSTYEIDASMMRDFQSLVRAASTLIECGYVLSELKDAFPQDRGQ